MVVARLLVVDLCCGTTTDIAAICVSLEDPETAPLPVTR
jgi:hypothetical protein